MSTPELQDFIRKAREHGQSDDYTKQQLIHAGWDEAMIKKALSEGSTPTMNAEHGSKLPGTVALIKEALAQYKRGFFKYIGILALPFLCGAAFSAAFIPLSSQFESGDTAIAPVIFIALLYILMVIVGVITQAAFIFTITDESLNIKQALQKGAKNIFSFAWLSLSLALVIYGALLAFIIPGLILTIPSTIAPFVWAKEGKKGIKAFTRAGHLVKGYWWAVFGRFLVVWLILFVPILGFGFLMETVEEGAISYILLGAYYLIVLFLSPALTIFIAKVYEQLQARKPELTEEELKKKSLWYRIFASLGVVLIVLGFAVIPFLLVTSLGKAREQARDVQTITALTQAQIGVELFYGTYGSYPVHPTPIQLGSANASVLTDDGFEASASEDDLVILDVVPKVNQPEKTFTYQSQDGSTYEILFELEADLDDIPAGVHSATPEGVN